MLSNNTNEWQEVPTPKATEPDAISRTVNEMALLYRKAKAAAYSHKTMQGLRSEFEEVVELIDLLNDDQRADVNALLHSSIERGSLVEILRSVLNVKRSKKNGK